MAANQCSCIIISIFSGLLMALFLAVTILGGIIAGMLKDKLTFAWVVLAAGCGGILFSVFGFFGACFRNDKKPRFPFCLVVFYIGILVLAICFVLLGSACFFVRPTFRFFLTMSIEEIKNLLSSFGLSTNFLLDSLDKLLNWMGTVGAICFAVAGVAAIVLITTSCHMGMTLFARFFIVSGAIIMLALGALIISIAAMYYKTTNLFNSGVELKPGAIIGLIVVGALMLLVGLFGIFTAIGMHRCKPLLAIFFICTCLLVLACTAIGILALALAGTGTKQIEELCEKTGSKCEEMLTNLKNVRCGHITDPDEKLKCEDAQSTADIIKLFSDMFGGWMRLGFVICILCVVFLVIVLFSTIMACRKPRSDDDDLSTPLPDYRAHKDVAY